ncbi:hypothetical protein ACROYT_G014847 [Oculina patagonica]
MLLSLQEVEQVNSRFREVEFEIKHITLAEEEDFKELCPTQWSMSRKWGLEQALRKIEEKQPRHIFATVLFYPDKGFKEHIKNIKRGSKLGVVDGVAFLKKLKKSAEHRKIVLQRKQALEEKRAAIPYKEIEADKSPGKVMSHMRLQRGQSLLKKLFVEEMADGTNDTREVDVVDRKGDSKVMFVVLLFEEMKSKFNLVFDRVTAERFQKCFRSHTLMTVCVRLVKYGSVFCFAMSIGDLTEDRYEVLLAENRRLGETIEEQDS